MGQHHVPRRLRSNQRDLEASGQVRLDYIESSSLTTWLATSPRNPIAIVSFGALVSQSVPCPVITLDLPQLCGRPLLEVWSSDQPVTVYRANEFSAAMSRDVLAASICLDEELGGGLTRTTQQGYQLLLAQLRELGFPHLWRIWNHFPRINEQEQGLERYKQFCVGRYQALAEEQSNLPASLPASTAVGTRSGPLHIYVLAGAQPATHLSNPRQVNPYEYPDTYGPCRPYFARATICRSESGSQLFVAGTARIVGHASQHTGLPGEQAREILRNLRTLLEHAEPHLDGLGSASTQAGLYKVYVRNPLHLSSIRATLCDRFLDSSRLLFLQGDLCRQELLVEIEGRISIDHHHSLKEGLCRQG